MHAHPKARLSRGARQLLVPISPKQLARFNPVGHRITNGKAERFIQPQASAKPWTLLEEWA
jgi:hypothetical protein